MGKRIENNDISWADWHWGPWPYSLQASPPERDLQHWAKPLEWNELAKEEGERRRVYTPMDVFSDGDAFVELRTYFFDLIRQTPHLDWMLRTSFPERIRQIIEQSYDWPVNKSAEKWWPVVEMTCDWLQGRPPANVWLGVAPLGQAQVESLIPALLDVRASLRFVQCDPLCEAIDLSQWLPANRYYLAKCRKCGWTATSDRFHLSQGCTYCDEADVICPKCEATDPAEIPGLGWIVAGGGHGPTAPPTHPAWARTLRDQAKAAKIPFFFKGWGEWAVTDVKPGGDIGQDMRRGRVQIVRPDREEDGRYKHGDELMRRVGPKKSGRLLDGVVWDEIPEVQP